MTTVNPASQFTPEDLLRFDGGDSLYELVDGALVEKHMSSLAGETATLIIMRLGAFVYGHRLGKLYTEASFRCFPDKSGHVRRPDIALILSPRLGDVPREGHIPIAPDLAIEIVSPNDLVYELEEKLADYRSAAIALTWVFLPEQRMVRVYESGRLKTELEGHELLSGSPVLPGFSATVAELCPAESTPK
jgi:Uma2 family endonuclease